MHCRAPKWAVVAAAFMVASSALPAAADTVPTIRVRLRPDVGAAGTLPPGALAKLEMLVGTGLTLSGTTRTGALDLALAEPKDSTAIAAALKALRNDRSVLWAETPRIDSVSAKTAIVPPPAANSPGRRLLVRLKDGATPDWATLLSGFASRIGTELAVERQIGNVWVLRTPLAYSPSQLAQMAEAIQQDA